MKRGRISETFFQARRESRAVLIAYLTAGDPDLSTTVDLAKILDSAGAGILELGVPFSDPIADGPTLQRAARRALEAGTTLSKIFACAAKIRRETNLALILFSYVNPLLANGFSRSMKEAREAGFDGVLLTDVPPEEAGEFAGEVLRARLDPIFLVSPTSPAARMRRAAHLSRGFLYVVSRTGTTGEKRRLAPELAVTAARARRAAPRLPIAVGFGISTPAAVRQAAALADGVVVGSALVAAAEKAGGHRVREVGDLCRAMAEACGAKITP